MSEWLPIATVPRDGTPVLVWLPEARTGSQVHAACYRPTVSLVAGHFDFDMPQPTHWMPLPEPPAQPSCGLCGRTVAALAPGRTICENCAHFPLD